MEDIENAKRTTIEGEELYMKDMQPSHLSNCIKMLERQIEGIRTDMVYMGDSDYAEDAVESGNRYNEGLRERKAEKIKLLQYHLDKKTK